MKNFKFLFALTASVVIIGFSTSCSKDDEGAKTINYAGYEVKNVTLYVGGQLVPGNYDATQYFREYFQENTRNGSFLTFDGNTLTYKDTENSYSFPYEFRNGKLLVNVNGEYFDQSYYGDKNRITQRRSLIKYSKGSSSGLTTRDDYSTLESLLESNNPFSSLGEMIAKDTLMWCNIDYIYK